MSTKKFKFIDLCAGIGGFHKALSFFNGECVLVSEIDKYAIETYKKNFGSSVFYDIKDVNKDVLPQYDLLCAGFPCQSFSKAGLRQGFNELKGTIFFEIYRILMETQPKFVLLENVRNLASHDNGKTWETIKNCLKQANYTVPENPICISPLNINIPQSRERVFIPCIHNKVSVAPINLNIPPSQKDKLSIYDILDMKLEDDRYYINDYEKSVLDIWDNFLQCIPLQTIGFPIWFEYLRNVNMDEIIDLPKWKQNIILKNNNLYLHNKYNIEQWRNKYNNLQQLKPTDKKFEWQMGISNGNSLYNGIIQFRPSGVRVKSSNFVPALVAIVHVPIIGKLLRRLTPRECARLQSFPDDFDINMNNFQAYKQFGNSVNIDVVKYVFKNTILQFIN